VDATGRGRLCGHTRAGVPAARTRDHLHNSEKEAIGLAARTNQVAKGKWT
jgi:hypothetical protein